MKPYINFHNEKRTECSKNKDKFGVDQYKLLNNSLFGQQIEAKKIASKITLKNWHILSEFVTLYELRKSNVLFDKPISIGFMIFKIAKFEMNIHYDRLKEQFGDNILLLHTDTDSFKLLIKHCNPYELERHELENLIDTSNFSIDTIFPLEPGKNEKCFGCLKFENGECSCFEFNSKAAKTYQERRINQ